jgi:hypothetical protein
MHVTGKLITGGLGAAALLLAVAAPASAAPPAAPAPIAVPGWAGYFTNDVVPRIDCSANPAGSFAGQALGVEFLNNFNGTTAAGHGPSSVVRAYCIGRTANYDAEFYFPNAAGTDELPVSAGVRVRPGDVVRTSVRVTASQSVDTLIDLSRPGGRARQTGLGATDAAPNVGLAALAGGAGGPTLIGSPAASSPPAPSTPVFFFASRIGHQPMAGAAGLGAQEWTNPAEASEVWAAPSGLTGNSFTVTVTP